jgi:Ca-activated chloride channel homolog
MSFSNPLFLLLLLLVPLAVLAVRWQRARARRYAVRFTAVPALRAAALAGRSWTRFLAPALLLGALGVLAFAVAGPKVTEAVPVQKATVVLVTDHSGSMQATDVQPTRLGAAQRAANTFIDKLPKSAQLGVVAYSTSPDAVQPPTDDHDLTRRIIDAQQAEGGTATGNALQTALDLVHSQSGSQDAPAAVVLLSDGATTLGADPVSIAQQSGKTKKVPVYTVALGTSNATIPNPQDPLGAPLSVAPDPETLQQIAKVSGGRAFSAESDEELSSIYQRLGSQLGSTSREKSIATIFAIGGLVLLVGAGGAAIATGSRL